MTEQLSRRVDAARVPVRKDWTPTPATHCSECGEQLQPDPDRVWSRATCPMCTHVINLEAFYNSLDGLEVW